MLSFLGATVLVLGIMGGSPGLSQPREDSSRAYEGAVRTYVRTGDVSQAVAGIRTWSIEQLEGVVERYVKRPAAALPAAAALHREIAINTVIAARELAVSHLELGPFVLRKRDLVDGARALVQSLTPEDSASLVTFAEPVELAVSMTRDRAALLKGLNSLQAFGVTALHDAIFLALQTRPQGAAEARSVILAFSDGRDTASWLSAPKLIEATRRSGVVVHVIELMPRRSRPRRIGAASRVLDEVAAAGGGRRWPAASSSDLRELFATVLEELRSRYLLTYFPANVTPDGWHDVKVTLKGARGDVIARPGYYVPPPE